MTCLCRAAFPVTAFFYVVGTKVVEDGQCLSLSRRLSSTSIQKCWGSGKKEIGEWFLQRILKPARLGVEPATQSPFVSTCVVVATALEDHNLALEPLSISSSKASLNNRVPDSLTLASWV